MRIAGALSTLLVAAGCVHYEDAPWTPDLGGEPFGGTQFGNYHLGPVDWGERTLRNSCGPYPDAIRGKLGPYLAIVHADEFMDPFNNQCDRCALITSSDGARRVYVRIVGSDDQVEGFGDMFLSQEAYDVLQGDAPSGDSAPMTWQLAECANTGPIVLQYATDATPQRTRVWARNSVLPVFMGVSLPGDDFIRGMEPQPDGSFATSDFGFGSGEFTITLLDIRDNSMQMETFDGFTAGALVETHMQF